LQQPLELVRGRRPRRWRTEHGGAGGALRRAGGVIAAGERTVQAAGACERNQSSDAPGAEHAARGGLVTRQELLVDGSSRRLS
jgi:hypothetical protein